MSKKLPAWLQWLIDLFKPKPKPDPPINDLDGCTFYSGRNISEWPQTITLSNARHFWHKVWFTYDRLQQIPVGEKNGVPNPDNVNGNIWLIHWHEGVKYCNTFDWLRKGQTEKAFGTGPKFQPKPGDKFGIMVSTMARNACNGTVAGGRTYRERSNVFWLTW